LAFATGGVTTTAPATASAAAPQTTLQSIGPLAFGPNDVLFAADTQGAAIYAFQLGKAAAGASAGTPDVAAIDQKIAAVLGTEAAAIAITDLAIHPTSKNAFIAVMRGQGADAKPALVRVDGAGRIDVLALDTLAHSKAALPNAPAAPAEGARRNPRADAITDMAFADGKLIVAGLSNEEFSSKLRTISYPFAAVEPGTSLEIYHGNHGALETRSPVYAFVPYTVGGTPHLIAGYLCTPLVKFPIDSLAGTHKVVGTTIAELGAGNRPIDMLVYSKDGRDYLLMSNTRRGVMKIPTDGFATASPITSRIGGTAGVPFETIATLTGVQQMDLLDATRTVIIASENGTLNLRAVPLP
jgi:hypothetical protein